MQWVRKGTLYIGQKNHTMCSDGNRIFTFGYLQEARIMVEEYDPVSAQCTTLEAHVPSTWEYLRSPRSMFLLREGVIIVLFWQSTLLIRAFSVSQKCWLRVFVTEGSDGFGSVTSWSTSSDEEEGSSIVEEECVKCVMCHKTIEERLCKDHVSEHLNCRPFICPFCGRRDSYAENIIYHCHQMQCKSHWMLKTDEVLR